MPGCNSQRRHGPHSSQSGDNFYAVSSSLILFWPLWVRIPESLPTKVVNCVILCIVCVSMCTVLLPPGVNPTAVNRYIVYVYLTYYMHLVAIKRSDVLKNLAVSTVSLLSHWSGGTTGMSNLNIPPQNSLRTIRVTSWKSRSLKSTAVINSNLIPDS